MMFGVKQSRSRAKRDRDGERTNEQIEIDLVDYNVARNGFVVVAADSLCVYAVAEEPNQRNVNVPMMFGVKQSRSRAKRDRDGERITEQIEIDLVDYKVAQNGFVVV